LFINTEPNDQSEGSFEYIRGARDQSFVYYVAFIYLNLETKYNAKAMGTYRHHSTYKSDM